MEGTRDTAAGLTEALAESVASALAPVRDHLATIEAQIAAKETELAELRAVRATAVRIIRAVDPEAIPKRPYGQRNGDGAKLVGQTPETLARVEAAIRKHFGMGADVIGAELAKRSGLDKTTAARGVKNLHAAGVLRLDRKEGNAMVYRLTTEGGSDASEQA